MPLFMPRPIPAEMPNPTLYFRADLEASAAANVAKNSPFFGPDREASFAFSAGGLTPKSPVTPVSVGAAQGAGYLSVLIPAAGDQKVAQSQPQPQPTV